MLAVCVGNEEWPGYCVLLHLFGAICAGDIPPPPVQVPNLAHLRRPRWPRTRIVVSIEGEAAVDDVE